MSDDSISLGGSDAESVSSDGEIDAAEVAELNSALAAGDQAPTCDLLRLIPAVGERSAGRGLIGRAVSAFQVDRRRSETAAAAASRRSLQQLLIFIREKARKGAVKVRLDKLL